MMMSRLLKMGAVVAGLGVLTACPLEEDFEEVEDCVPGQVRCRADGRVDDCNDDGVWAPNGSFICPGGTCMVMENVPVCM